MHFRNTSLNDLDPSETPLMTAKHPLTPTSQLDVMNFLNRA